MNKSAVRCTMNQNSAFSLISFENVWHKQEKATHSKETLSEKKIEETNNKENGKG